jgi:hypothetical protein
MRSPCGDRMQANPPTEQDILTGEMKAKVDATLRILEVNRKALFRWFLYGLVGFNLVLWSVTLPIAFLVR